MNIEDILPIEIWYRFFVYLNNSHDLINLFHISKFSRNFVLSRQEKYFFLSTGFCAFEFWERRLRSNRFNLLSKSHKNLIVFFIMNFGQQN